jgi:uncharacterized protein (DUF58 family)
MKLLQKPKFRFDDRKMSIIQKYELLLQPLLDGPEWLYIKSLDRNGKLYRSPTVALFAWGVGWAYRWLTVPGRIMISAFAVIFFYGAVSFDSPSRILVLMLIVFFIFDFVLSFLFRPRVELQRTVPPRVRAGAAFQIDYNVVNLRKMPLWDLKLDSYPFKTGLDWVHHGAVGGLPGGKSIKAAGTLQAEHRGKYLLYSPIAEVAFPLGIFKRSFRKRNACDTLLVYPSYYSLNSLALPFGLKYQRDGISRASKVGESMDFFGCREFRDGDDAKHIYWPGSARTGELIVKEYQAEYLTRIALIIDTYLPKPKSFRIGKKNLYSAELEAGLSLAAAVTEFLTKGEYVVDIFAAGTDVYHFQSGRHLTGFDAILDIIACLELNHEHPIHRLSAAVLEEISGIGSAVLVLLGWDEEREELVRRMREAGVALRIIVIGKHLTDLPPEITAVSVDDIVGGRVRNL